MKRSIFFKIFSGYLLTVLVLSTLILVFSFQAIRTYYLDVSAENLGNLATSLELRIESLLEEESYEDLNARIRRLGKEINTRITVIDKDGWVLVDSETDPETLENHRGRPEVIRALEGAVGRSLRFSNTLKEEMLYVAIPLYRGGEIVGVLRTSLFSRDINLLLGDLRTRILSLSLAVIVLALFGVILFSRSLSRPIGALSDGAQRVASGDFDARVILRNKDELGELAESFNNMTEKIKTLFADLELQKEELNSIISSIQQGLLVLDREGRVRFSNQSFQMVFQNDDLEGKYYWEILREPGLADLVQKVSTARENLVDEIDLRDRTFACSATFIAANEEIVIILHDITAIKNLEKVKKDFVANVSHELRTPLTAIKGFVETLDEEVREDLRRYVRIIQRHTDRLSNIVRDLVLLSDLEEGERRTEFEPVPLPKLVEDAILLFAQKLEEKNLAIVVEVPPEFPSIQGDPFRLEQLLINLIDNAIKYTEAGEIRVILKEEGERVRIEVHDSGIGIPADDIARIFERFYVVNKSRSKLMGGTGLGLSIVKHIVLLHGGDIHVQSRVGIGTTFSVTLPKVHS
jgi:two-component system phosphate regulon sensor histidine kinase PhoR